VSQNWLHASRCSIFVLALSKFLLLSVVWFSVLLLSCPSFLITIVWALLPKWLDQGLGRLLQRISVFPYIVFDKTVFIYLFTYFLPEYNSAGMSTALSWLLLVRLFHIAESQALFVRVQLWIPNAWGALWQQYWKKFPKLTSGFGIFIYCLLFIISWSSDRLSPLGTSATNWPIVPAPDDRWWMLSSRWNENWQGTPK
jgi:hypothetical protein